MPLPAPTTSAVLPSKLNMVRYCIGFPHDHEKLRVTYFVATASIIETAGHINYDAIVDATPTGQQPAIL